MASSAMFDKLYGRGQTNELFGTRNEVDLMKAGTSVILRNAKIDMYMGSGEACCRQMGPV
ncbi:hypothetical protein HPP92_019516 [Vanilla planifolia]|uniref:Single-stranded DNA binding protein Ssb-like OB fold domain-containing protein n=1 Tax=Vanilla planifolia TaxID=51239 RepID=A0A835UKU0_VANPL|nr:hypothetical protein HPP92_019516 [Vanilla planifolia]